jgi:hypothetical protein
MSCVGVTFYQPLHKENGKRMASVSHAVPRTVKITINTLLAGEFITCLLILVLLCSPRFSDRDLLMRYHWGLGVGHFHAHQSAATLGCVSDLAEDSQDIQAPDMEPREAFGETLAQANDRGSDMDYESDNPELCLQDRDLEGWDDIEMDDVEDGDGDEDIGELEDFTGMY